MPDDVVSLFSDTGTQPTAAMRAAMAAAEVGDEQEGQDPTVNRLQERVAGLLGKEAALWFPSGTMCNLVAVKLHTRPGDVVIAEGQAHVVRAESGGAALASGVLVEPIRTERGIFTAAELEAAFDRVHTVPPPWGAPAGLICVEQTHNLGGGSVWPLGALDAVAACAREHGVPVHMDGARLLNACTASGVSAAAFAARADSVWIDFTKGLGAPIGAVLAGSRAFVRRARRYKQLFGGGMRQAGIAAAGCLHALDHHVERLAVDHEHARILARGLASVDRHPTADAGAGNQHRVLRRPWTRHEQRGIPGPAGGNRNPHELDRRLDPGGDAPRRLTRRHRAGDRRGPGYRAFV